MKNEKRKMKIFKTIIISVLFLGIVAINISIVGSITDTDLSFVVKQAVAEGEGGGGNYTEHTCVNGWDEGSTFPFLKRRCPNCMSDFTNENNRSTCWR